jgi:hypothetical protein
MKQAFSSAVQGGGGGDAPGLVAGEEGAPQSGRKRMVLSRDALEVGGLFALCRDVERGNTLS